MKKETNFKPTPTVPEVSAKDVAETLEKERAAQADQVSQHVDSTQRIHDLMDAATYQKMIEQ